MGVFLITALLGGLWVHYASRWFRFGPPTWTSTFGTVALGNVLATLVILQFLIRPTLAPWSSALIFALVSFAALAFCFALMLRDGAHRRPSLTTALGLSATTTAVMSLPGVLLAFLPDEEAL